MHPSFDLTGRCALITGGCGLLGRRHAHAIAASGGVPVLIDLPAADPEGVAEKLGGAFGARVLGMAADITDRGSVEGVLERVLAEMGRVDILINNAANNPKQEASNTVEFSRFEHFPIAQLDADMKVGVTGALIMCQVVGAHMAQSGGGVILNISSDLGVIAPDQRLYAKPGLPPDRQPVKPVSYSLVKTALIGLTRYLATYWADSGVRVNAISPGGVANGQPEEFVEKLARLIPMGRMANADEYEGAIVFLCSDASSYMTGANLVIDGGRSCW